MDRFAGSTVYIVTIKVLSREMEVILNVLRRPEQDFKRLKRTRSPIYRQRRCGSSQRLPAIDVFCTVAPANTFTDLLHPVASTAKQTML